MTERLYYDQSYLRQFDACVVSTRPGENGSFVTLTQSAFYPTSGGQPFDTGVLIKDGETLFVRDVKVEEGEVWHLVQGTLMPGDQVHGRIDWERRFDHMQQHGGEHMLAGVIYKELSGTTIGLHLGECDSSIDVALPDGRTRLTREEIRRIEAIVNRHIQQNEAIHCWFPTEAELAALPLRKPPTVNEHIRIVDIGGWEMVACGGTHPAHTGQIGLVHILSVLPARGKARVTFVCGMRALNYLSLCADATEGIGRLLSVQPGEAAAAVAELKNKCAELEKQLKSFLSADYEQRLTDANGVLYLQQGDSAALQEAVSRYILIPGRLVVCGIGGRLIFARSADRQEDMAALLRTFARGGGKPDMASGAGGEAEVMLAAKKLNLL